MVKKIVLLCSSVSTCFLYAADAARASNIIRKQPDHFLIHIVDKQNKRGIKFYEGVTLTKDTPLKLKEAAFAYGSREGLLNYKIKIMDPWAKRPLTEEELRTPLCCFLCADEPEKQIYAEIS